MRVNGLDTPWWLEDLGMAAKAKPDGILVPKVPERRRARPRSPTGSAISAPNHAIRVWIMIETPLGVLRVAESPRLGAMQRCGLQGW